MTRVILVDTHEAQLAQMRRWLAGLYELVSFGETFQAWRYIVNNRPDIVVIRADMPHIRAGDLRKAIQLQWPDVKFVYLVYPNVMLRTEAVCLYWPFTSEALRKAIEAVREKE
jgi:response regulator RpfG family c-di-GMP phosphodiesterase